MFTITRERAVFDFVSRFRLSTLCQVSQMSFTCKYVYALCFECVYGSKNNKVTPHRQVNAFEQPAHRKIFEQTIASHTHRNKETQDHHTTDAEQY